MKKKQGFTLIELLVVISIISVLIAILLPALSSARSAAKSVLCLANLRSVGTSLEVYAQTYDWRLTYYQHSRNPGGGDETWISLLYKTGLLSSGAATGGVNTKAHESLMCPSLPVDASDPSRLKYRGYGMTNRSQYLQVDLGPSAYQYFSYRIDEMGAPGEFIILADSVFTIPGFSRYGGQTYGWASAATSSSKAHARHSESVNAAYLDGHATRSQPEAFKSAYARVEGATRANPFYMVVGESMDNQLID